MIKGIPQIKNPKKVPWIKNFQGRGKDRGRAGRPAGREAGGKKSKKILLQQQHQQPEVDDNVFSLFSPKKYYYF